MAVLGVVAFSDVAVRGGPKRRDATEIAAEVARRITDGVAGVAVAEVITPWV
jgi:hypothetical protein